MKDLNFLDIQKHNNEVRIAFEITKNAIENNEADIESIENTYLKKTHNPIYWTDLRVPFTRDKQGQSSKPDFDFTDLGLLFPQNNATEIVYMILQFGHDRKNSSNIRPHFHFVQNTSDEPVFKMDYRWYKNGSDPSGSFTTLTNDGFVFEYSSGSILQIATFPEIDGSTIDTVSSMMDIRFYRDDNVVSGDILGKEFDIHYQVDSQGSVQEFSK